MEHHKYRNAGVGAAAVHTKRAEHRIIRRFVRYLSADGAASSVTAGTVPVFFELLQVRGCPAGLVFFSIETVTSGLPLLWPLPFYATVPNDKIQSFIDASFNYLGVKIAYDCTFNIREVRQAHLQQQYFFTCTCRFCVDPHLEAERYAVKCSNPECTEAIPLPVALLTEPTEPTELTELTESSEPTKLTELIKLIEPIEQQCASCSADNQKRFLAAKLLIDQIVEGQKEKIPTEFFVEINNVRRRCCLEEMAKEGDVVLHGTNMALALVNLDLHRLLEEEEKVESGIACLKKALPALEKHANKYESAATGALSDLMHDAMNRRKFEEAYAYGEELVRRLKTVPGEQTPVYSEYSRLRDDCELATWARAKPNKKTGK